MRFGPLMGGLMISVLVGRERNGPLHGWPQEAKLHRSFNCETDDFGETLKPIIHARSRGLAAGLRRSDMGISAGWSIGRLPTLYRAEDINGKYGP
jgi:hypothetical protein